MNATEWYEVPVNKVQGLVALLGRALVASVFLFGAVQKMIDPPAAVAMMVAQGMPAAAFLLVGAIIVELVGALAILTGVLSRQAAVILSFYLVPVTLIFHNFLAVPPLEAPLQLIMAVKNLSIMGGLFLIVAFGPGPLVLEPEKLILRRRAAVTPPQQPEATDSGEEKKAPAEPVAANKT